MHIQHRANGAVGVAAIATSQTPAHGQADCTACLEDGTIPTTQLVVVKPAPAKFILDMRIGAQLHEQ